jgi:hypothetical protein
MSLWKDSSLMRRVVLAAWGMGTMVLAFTVVLLVYVLFERDNELPPVKPPAAVPESVHDVSERLPAKNIQVYFADSGGNALAAESVAIEFGDYTVDNCRNALEALIHGPKTSLTPILPSSAKVLGLYLMDEGELVVDFSFDLPRELRKTASAGLESLLFYGVTNTLAQPALKGEKEPAVSRVRFLIEGATPRDTFPVHIDLSDPLMPDPQWIAGAVEQRVPPAAPEAGKT